MLRVLVVDDELPALEELAYLLRRDGRVGDVRTAASGAGALRALEHEPVDAVFLDIRMPGLTGLELAGCWGSSRGRRRSYSSPHTKPMPSTRSSSTSWTTCSSRFARNA